MPGREHCLLLRAWQSQVSSPCEPRLPAALAWSTLKKRHCRNAYLLRVRAPHAFPLYPVAWTLNA